MHESSVILQKNLLKNSLRKKIPESRNVIIHFYSINIGPKRDQ